MLPLQQAVSSFYQPWKDWVNLELATWTFWDQTQVSSRVLTAALQFNHCATRLLFQALYQSKQKVTFLSSVLIPAKSPLWLRYGQSVLHHLLLKQQFLLSQSREEEKGGRSSKAVFTIWIKETRWKKHEDIRTAVKPRSVRNFILARQ